MSPAALAFVVVAAIVAAYFYAARRRYKPPPLPPPRPCKADLDCPRPGTCNAAIGTCVAESAAERFYRRLRRIRAYVQDVCVPNIATLSRQFEAATSTHHDVRVFTPYSSMFSELEENFLYTGGVLSSLWCAPGPAYYDCWAEAWAGAGGAQKLSVLLGKLSTLANKLETIVDGISAVSAENLLVPPPALGAVKADAAEVRAASAELAKLGAAAAAAAG